MNDTAATAMPPAIDRDDVGAPEPSANSAPRIAEALNELLADNFALYMKTKSFHWHVTGQNFRDYHLMFEEQADQLFAATDIIAERVRSLGQRTLTSIGSIAGRSRIADNDDASIPAEAMLTALIKDNEDMVRYLRAVKELVDEAGDNATSGFIDQWTDEAEKRVWFLRSSMVA